jgi:tyrosine-protein kinase Etk/Wzc
MSEHKPEVPLKVFDGLSRVATASREPRHEPDLREYVDTVVGARWTILGAALAVLLAGFVYLFFAAPIYEADALVQIEERKNTIAGLEDLSDVFGRESPADTEIEILRSRMLAGSVVDQLRLDIFAAPHFLPLVGRGIARRNGSDGLARPFLGLSSYAWGGERIAVEQLDVPERWIGKTLTLVARSGGRYDLLDPERERLASGEVGKRMDSGGVYLLVTQLVAREGTRFDIGSLPRDDLVENLQTQIAASEKGKKTGVIRIALEGPDPARVARIVDAFARAYVQQNVERKSAEAEKTLQFITGQLPQLKANVENAEAALNAYRKNRGGGVDLTLETKAALDRTAEIEKMLTQLAMQRSEMQSRFTASHPVVEALSRKAAQLNAERAELEKDLRKLPETQLQAARLTGNVKVANELYVLLLNKAQELQVVKSGTIGNVRILDVPRPPRRPVKPVPTKTVIVSILLGAAVGVGLAFVRRALDQSVDDPDAIEQATGFPVVATIPHSQQLRDGPTSRKSPRRALAAVCPEDLAVEALRSLRTSLQVALSEARNNVVTISGPSPEIGKTFVSLNLAHVTADVGKRVLLVDADVRKGRLHDYFGVPRTPGLSDVIRGTASRNDAVRSTATPNLLFVPAGTRPSNPSELLSSSAFQEFLASVRRDVDLILIDTPPLLAVTDAALVGRLAATNLMVLRADHHAMREIKLAVRRLEQNGVMPWAIVLNDVKPKLAGYSRYHYHYEYK